MKSGGWVGLVVARGIDEEFEFFMWARAVAIAVLAGDGRQDRHELPPGTLAVVPLGIWLGAIACGFVAFLAVRRSVFAGVIAGESALTLARLPMASYFFTACPRGHPRPIGAHRNAA